ncbi:MAG TPA: sugar O-acetyltransferase [Candidatus Limnocylindrales bacterium]|nr:sugar O-acetyltransferase [Candidatus Limnocylindrales bacterium]
MGEMKQRMLRGEDYIVDAELSAEHRRAMLLLERFNASSIDEDALRTELLTELVGAVGEGSVIRPPFLCDYGSNIRIGRGTFVNFGAVFLDVSAITIGDDVQIATNVQLLTATHPLDPERRRAGWESGRPITLADGAWLGGGVIVLPGVTVGENAVVGAGAVVTRDVEPNVVAAGNPARVIRRL